MLYTGQEIRKEVQRIFARISERRVAVVAFIGKGARAHLPNPDGLEVYCWPRAGCTVVSAIEDLRARGASVHFAERMHAKVYWSSKSGAVIASANVSDNAFCSGNLHEAGIAIASKDVDIDRLIWSIDANEVTPELLAELRRAESIERNLRRRETGKVTIPTFPEWHQGRRGRAWKWDFYNDFGGGVWKRARAAVKKIDPTYIPQDFVYCNRGSFRAEDWIPRVHLTGGGALISPEWVYVERVVLVARDDRVYDPNFPYQAVQARERRHCPPPPFTIDPAFRSALKRASIAFGAGRVEAQVYAKPPTRTFLDRIQEQY